MIPAILGKTLRDRRRAVMGFGLGIVALAVWLGVMFTVMRESDDFSEFMNNLPAGLLSAFGIDSATFLSAAGFLSSYLFTLFAPLFVLFFVINAAANEVMAEERDGLIDMVLSSPVTRTRVFLEKTAGVALAALALVAVLTVSLLVVDPIFDLSLSVNGVLAAGLSLWLLGVVFAALALVAGTFTGRSVMAGGVAGSLAFLTWFVSGFSDLYPPLETFDRASPFTWYQEPDPLTNGIGPGQLWLAATAAVLITVATLMFRRRDLSTERTLPAATRITRLARKRRGRSVRAAWLLTGSFRKTVWDRRRSVWGWGGGLGLLTLVLFSVWPTIASDAEALSGLITSLPREVFAMFGMSDPAAIVTPAGFVSSRTYQAIGPILIIMFVVRGVSMALVKEESDGAFDLALSVPSSRKGVIAAKATGVAFSTGLVIVVVTAAAVFGNLAWETDLDAGRILAAGAGLGLLGLFFGGLTMVAWAFGGPSFPAARITAVVAMATFLLNGLGSLTDALEAARVISPFYWYFGDAPPLAKGFEPAYFLLLAGALAMGSAAVMRIDRRDIAT
ncbi:MAG: ABC transporter permease subunit [Acidimicrobiia bacterium]|nr:ABC transporter permease subunit [Acidimicrobiia bacterium]MXY75417.1 ABC transporter permease subunit [Acidimicrobiia bacterium]MYB79300.1 ABC transporter permease subunit [Acidimicrobiia bacterium]